MITEDRTCEWGHSELCGKPATWVLYPDKFPGSLYACDRHAPRMADADRAHRLPSAPALSLVDLEAYVTALAWQAFLLRESNPLRSSNARAAFRTARDEFFKRGGVIIRAT